MYTHAPFDESSDALPRWATITQVSSALLVPRTTVRGAVRRALAEGEPWVRRADADDEQSPYLVDTTHPLYLAHVERWRDNQSTQEEEEEQGHQGSHPSSFDPFFSTYTPSAQLSPFSPPRHTNEVLSRWSFFRERLYSWGVQIFQNILADEDDWQWRWGELHGEGYLSEEEAIVAALESRLAPREDVNPLSFSADAPLSPTPTIRRASREQPPDRPFWMFPRRHRRRHFS